MKRSDTPEEIPVLSLMPDDLLSDSGFQHQFSIRETYPLHTHTFYEFFLINKGKGIHRINGSSTLLLEGSFVLIRPSDRHGYDFLNQYDLELINVSFLPVHFDHICRLLDCSSSLFTQPNLCPQLTLREPALSDIREKMLRIGSLEKGVKRKQYLLSVLPYFLYQFLSALPTAQASPLPAWLSGLVSQMEKPENFVAGLPRLIELANLSQEYLTRSFQRYLKMTPTQFVNLRRMELAATLLVDKRMEIIDVCQECGFHNLGYFYRVFQKQYGCSPGQFIKNSSAPSSAFPSVPREDEGKGLQAGRS